MGIYIGHIISLILYMIALAACPVTWVRIKRIPKPYCIPFYLLLSALSIVCSLFLILQIDWIISNHNEAVGDLTSYVWLAFDYANVLFYLFTIGSINTCITLYCIQVNKKPIDL